MMLNHKNRLGLLPGIALMMLIGFFLTGCTSTGSAMVEPTGLSTEPVAAPTERISVQPTATQGIEPSDTKAPTFTAEPSTTPSPSPTIEPTATLEPSPTAYVQPPPEQWKTWSVLPMGVSEEMRQVYQRGLLNGTNPNAFTVLGDCQGDSETFLGLFKTDQALVSSLPLELQETIDQFDGSFSRYNPAAKSGSSAGSLLWAEWNDNEAGQCAPGETPLDCELRVHRPSIVFVHLGTHYEVPDRNYRYMSIIVERIIATGAVPIMVTKADKLEGDDEYVNRNIATLAEEYNLPLWNFWASVQDLPAHGLLPNGMHLTDAAHEVHRLGALQALDVVWRALQ